jgi:CubicO group peptidase (beta-lactamase class C family)
MMHRNQMPADMPHNVLGARGTSFGLDFAIIENPVETESYSKGEFYWGGAAGTWFWIDPGEVVVFVGMIQQFGGNGHAVPNVRGVSRQAFYQAIVQPAMQ